MSVTTILIPVEQVDAIRESLLASHGQLVEELAQDGPRATGGVRAGAAQVRARLALIERLLEQIGRTPSPEPTACRLTGSRKILWSAAYDAVGIAAERLADVCGSYWRGSIAPADVHARIADLSARFELLEALGPPDPS